jgi:hypothetical protein
MSDDLPELAKSKRSHTAPELSFPTRKPWVSRLQNTLRSPAGTLALRAAPLAQQVEHLDRSNHMSTAIRCQCGRVRGEVDLSRAYTRATCYCKDCQAFSRYLKRPDMVDRCGGTDIVPMSPAGVRITDGLQNVVCMSLSGKGRLRWHTACCQTPLGNTPRSRKIAYVGMIMTCFDAAPDTIDATLGPRDRIVLNTSSATCKLRSTPLPFLTGGLNILRHIVIAKLRAPQPSPFFDAQGPLRAPIVLTAAQRESLGANRA